MQYRIYKKLDNSIVVGSFAKHYYEDGKIISTAPHPEPYKDLEYIDIDVEGAPDFTYVEQFYFDGPCTIENLKQDVNFETVLMSPRLIQRKHFDKLSALLKDPNNQDDFKSMFKWKLVCDQIPQWTDLQCYEQALQNLDDAVQEGKKDKPVVRQKLESKIVELKLNH
jgi:hypothetical protein